MFGEKVCMVSSAMVPLMSPNLLVRDRVYRLNVVVVVGAWQKFSKVSALVYFTI